MRHTIRWLSAGLLTVVTAACSDYQLKVNDRVVYNPPALFAGYDIADAALKTCVAQTITDQHITAARQLLRLRCSNAGITTLNGIETFTALQAVDLDHNHITNIAPLAELGSLTELHLAGNDIRNVRALSNLAHLDQLDLRGNPHLDCASADHLATRPELPDHCEH